MQGGIIEKEAPIADLQGGADRPAARTSRPGCANRDVPGADGRAEGSVATARLRRACAPAMRRKPQREANAGRRPEDDQSDKPKRQAGREEAGGRKAEDARSTPPRGRRTELKEYYDARSCPQLMKRFAYTHPHAGARASRRSWSTWAWGRPDEHQAARRRRGRPGDRSPARSRRSAGRRSRSRISSCATGVPIGCMVTLRGRADVGVPGAAHDRGDPAHPRLPRALAASRSTAAATTPSASRSR